MDYWLVRVYHTHETDREPERRAEEPQRQRRRWWRSG